MKKNILVIGLLALGVQLFAQNFPVPNYPWEGQFLIHNAEFYERLMPRNGEAIFRSNTGRHIINFFGKPGEIQELINNRLLITEGIGEISPIPCRGLLIYDFGQQKGMLVLLVFTWYNPDTWVSSWDIYYLSKDKDFIDSNQYTVKNWIENWQHNLNVSSYILDTHIITDDSE
jgi:hypothetical protein